MVVLIVILAIFVGIPLLMVAYYGVGSILFIGLHLVLWLVSRVGKLLMGLFVLYMTLKLLDLM